jgi:hypothetical protein
MHLSLRLSLLRVHLALRLSLLCPHVALSLGVLHSLRAHLLAFVHLRLSVHCRATLRVAAAAARRKHSRLGRVEVGACAASCSESGCRCPRGDSGMAASSSSSSSALLDRASGEMRITPAATAVRTAAAVAAAGTCVGSCGNCQGRSACEKNEPFHGETPFRSPAKRFANRPVPPFMCMKGEYSGRQLA